MREQLDPPRLGMWSADGAEYFPTPAQMQRDLRRWEAAERRAPRSIFEIPALIVLIRRLQQRKYSAVQVRLLAERWNRELDAMILLRRRRAPSRR